MRSIWTIKTNIINVNIIIVQIILCKRVQAIPRSESYQQKSYRQLKTKIFFTPWGIWFCSPYRQKNTKNKNWGTNYPYKINKKEISSFCEEEGEKLGKWIVEFSKGMPKRI